MEIKKAITRARKDEKVRRLDDYFLGSCFACVKDAKDSVKEWTLLFYNPKKHRAVDCFVNEKFVTIGTETKPLKKVEKFNPDDVEIPLGRAMDIIGKRYKKQTVNVLITLHSKKHTMWTVNMISKDMTATTFDVDAKTGKLMREDTTSLIRKL